MTENAIIWKRENSNSEIPAARPSFLAVEAGVKAEMAATTIVMLMRIVAMNWKAVPARSEVGRDKMKSGNTERIVTACAWSGGQPKQSFDGTGEWRSVCRSCETILLRTETVGFRTLENIPTTVPTPRTAAAKN